MTAIRVLICWVYRNTNSVLLAQLIHISSTGSLVIFSPLVSPRQEVFWYGIYAVVLWLVAGIVAVAFGPLACNVNRSHEHRRRPVGP